MMPHTCQHQPESKPFVQTPMQVLESASPPEKSKHFRKIATSA
ncbi:hypothetical protein DOY81_013476 [Sarcophaga bullata]|nr:hypothetical protein DOY81_013476 [Sarcophaga bullata]